MIRSSVLLPWKVTEAQSQVESWGEISQAVESAKALGWRRWGWFAVLRCVEESTGLEWNERREGVDESELRVYRAL